MINQMVKYRHKLIKTKIFIYLLLVQMFYFNPITFSLMFKLFFFIICLIFI